MSSVNLYSQKWLAKVQASAAGYAARNLDYMLFACLMLFKVMEFNGQIGVMKPTGFLAASLGSVLIIAGCILLLPITQRALFLYLCDILISLIMLADLFFYRYYSDVISIPVLLQVAQAGSVKQSVFSLFQLGDLIFLFDLPLLLPLLKISGKARFSAEKVLFRKRAAKAMLLFFCGISLISFKVINLENTMGKRVFTNILDQTFFVENIGILNFHAFDFYKYAKKQLSQKELSRASRQEISQWFASTPPAKPEQSKYFGIAKNQNLIVVQVEALQSFVINKKINGREITPNLNRLLNNSIYFNNFYFQTAQGNTSDAEFLVNVSYYPAREGSVYFQYAANRFNSLPGKLREAGYTTMAIHAYKPSYWNRAAMYRSLGFEAFYSKEDFIPDEQVGWGLGDKSFFKQSAAKLAAAVQPFYAFLVTLSSHYPYDAFSAGSDFDPGRYAGTFLGNYFKAIHYADAALGSFIEELKANGLWENSVVAVYGDHSAVSKVEKDDLLAFLAAPDDELTWAKLQKVPLIIHLPGDAHAGTKNITGGQIDLFPTLANLLGLKVPNLLGQDLLSSTQGLAVFRNGSFTDGKIFYLQTSGQVYDVKSGEILPVEQYTAQIAQAQKRLWISDQVLEHDLMPSLN